MEIVKIDLVPSGVLASCHASQYDIGREIRFLLFDGGAEYTLAGTETISIELRKPDGTSETIAIQNTSANYIDWETSDGELDLSGVYLAEISIKNGDDVIGSANFIVKTEADAYDGADIRTVTVGPADICTFETTLPEPLSVTVDVEATGGNGTPDSPNPIVGYSSANITRCGVNLFDKTTTVNDYYISDGNGQEIPRTGSKCTDYISVKGGTSYYIKTDATSGNWGAWYDIDKNFISGITGGGVKTSPANAYFLRFSIIAIPPSTGNPDTFGINYPATDTTYHAYTGNTYTVAFGQTVYGGQLDVTSGKLHVDMYLFTTDFTGASDIGGGFYRKSVAIPYNAVYPAVKPQLCNVAPHQASYAGQFTHFYCNLDTAIIVLPDDTPASTEIEILYELATPIDIDLTPEVISAIVGDNNVFADCGQSTVKYVKVGA